MVPQEGFSCTRSPQRAAEAKALTAGNVYMHVREEKFPLSPLECDICDFNGLLNSPFRPGAVCPDLTRHTRVQITGICRISDRNLQEFAAQADLLTPPRWGELSSTDTRSSAAPSPTLD